MAYVSLTTLKQRSDFGFLYFKRWLDCFKNSSTLIAVIMEHLFGDLFKPMLAEYGAKNDKKQEELSKHTNKHNEPVKWCIINAICRQVDCTINSKSREQAPK